VPRFGADQINDSYALFAAKLQGELLNIVMGTHAPDG